jgi:Ca2+-binding EF-hand superfamily protein
MNVSISGAYGGASTSHTQSGNMNGRLEKLFNKFDTNGDGTIDKDELATAQANSEDGSRDAELLSSLTTDSNGGISKDDFKSQVQALFAQKRGQGAQGGAPPPPPDAADMFSKVDANGDGSLDQSELEEMASMGPEGGPSASQMLKEMDTDGSGTVSQDEFKAQMEKMQSNMMAGAGNTGASEGTATDSSGASDETTSAEQLALLLANAIKSYNQANNNGVSLAASTYSSSLSAGGLYA